MMNRLQPKKQAEIVACLVEGISIRATSRRTGAPKNTMVKLQRGLEAALRQRA